jgi:hypothetical protein
MYKIIRTIDRYPHVVMEMVNITTGEVLLGTRFISSRTALCRVPRYRIKGRDT